MTRVTPLAAYYAILDKSSSWFIRALGGLCSPGAFCLEFSDAWQGPGWILLAKQHRYSRHAMILEMCFEGRLPDPAKFRSEVLGELERITSRIEVYVRASAGRSLKKWLGKVGLDFQAVLRGYYASKALDPQSNEREDALLYDMLFHGGPDGQQ